MKGLSKTEIELIANLEFEQRYFFSSDFIRKFSGNTTQRYNITKNLLKKGRILKVNRNKYYLVPIKARSGKWTEHPFIIADEILDGKDYFIGGWSAANYWKLTDQIPMRTDVWTTRRQGKKEILNNRFVFHRTTNKKANAFVKETIEGHTFRIMPKEEARKWIKSRD